MLRHPYHCRISNFTVRGILLLCASTPKGKAGIPLHICNWITAEDRCRETISKSCRSIYGICAGYVGSVIKAAQVLYEDASESYGFSVPYRNLALKGIVMGAVKRIIL